MTALPATEDTNTSVDFGTSGAKTITFDPFTAGRTTTGLVSGFGWAINIAGSDGMDGTATAKRWIKAGTWAFQGNVFATPAAALNAVTIGVNVYRVAASPSTTRTLLFSSSVSAGLVTTAGTDWTLTTASQAEIVLEAGETIQVTYTAAGTGQVGGLVVAMRTGDSFGPLLDTRFDVPSPGIRTLGEGAGAASGAGTVDGVGGKVLATVGASTGTGAASGAMSAIASMTGSAAGASTVTGVLGATGSMTGTAAGTATATGVGGKVLGTVGTVEIGSGTPAPSSTTVIFGTWD